MKFLQNISVFLKILLLGLISVIVFAILIAGYIYPTYKNNMFAAKEEQNKNMVNSAASTVERYVEFQKDGQMTMEAAQMAAMDAVRFMRYDNGNYFWINDLTPKFIMHPNVSSVDKPDWFVDGGLKDYVDPTGKHIFLEFNKIATEKGEGIVAYEWPKTGKPGDPASAKISYVKLIPEWGWVIGTGVYVDDVQAAVNSAIINICLSVVGIIALSAFMFGFFITRGITKKLRLSNIELQNEIEQRKIVQELLATEKELVSTTLMSIGEGVIATDKHGLIFLYNHSAGSISGYSEDEAMYHPFTTVFKIIDSVPPHSIINIIPSSTEQSKNTIPVKHPALITKSKGKILIEYILSALESNNGEIVGYVLIFQNISEKQRQEAQTALSQKMESLGQLASGIAHEINTPLQFITSNLKFLQDSFSNTSDVINAYGTLHLEANRSLSSVEIANLEEITKGKDLEYYLEESQKAISESLDGIGRVSKIILAMREFSHSTEKEKRESDINHGIETTALISKNEWKQCAELIMDLDPELPLVYCQIDGINQVILNMIVNAVQAIQEKKLLYPEEKGEIYIKTQKVGGNVEIIIQDNGVGISETNLTRVFDPFYTTKGVGKGTGQGLSLSHNIIVKQHNGNILVDSKQGEWTKFIIVLPINIDHQKASNN